MCKNKKSGKRNNKKSNTSDSSKSIASDTDASNFDSESDNDCEEETDEDFKEIKTLFKPEKIKSKDDILCGKCFIHFKNPTNS